MDCTLGLNFNERLPNDILSLETHSKCGKMNTIYVPRGTWKTSLTQLYQLMGIDHLCCWAGGQACKYLLQQALKAGKHSRGKKMTPRKSVEGRLLPLGHPTVCCDDKIQCRIIDKP